MVLSLPPLRPSVRPLPVLPYCAPHSIAPGPDWLQMLLLRAVDWCRPRRCRGLSSSCSSLCAAGSRAARMRPKAWPPRPPKGCRRTRGSIVVVPSFSIHLSLCSTGFHRLHCSYEEIRLLHGHRPVVVASFRSTARADPCRPPWVTALDVPPRPPPLPPRPRLDFGRRVRRHAHPAGPACSGVHLRSVLRFASGFFSTRPHGARAGVSRRHIPACSCLRLAVATNSPRKGLSPLIQCPCQAHLRPPCATPRQWHITKPNGRRSTYRTRNAVST